MPRTYTFVGDFAHALIILGEQDEALGKIWHVPSPPTLTTRQFVEWVYREVGTEPKRRVVSRGLVNVLSLFVPTMRELKEMLYEFEAPFGVDHSRFERASALSSRRTKKRFDRRRRGIGGIWACQNRAPVWQPERGCQLRPRIARLRF